MRTLKYAILGLLSRGAMTGYDIAKAFEKGLGNFWSAGHSQIYPELKKLTDECLVEFCTVIQGEKMEKKSYTLTDMGRDDFLKWILRDEPLEPTPKDAFKLRVYLSDAIDDNELLLHLKSQMIKRAQKLEMLEETLRDRYEGLDVSKLNRAQRGDYLVLQGAIMRERNYYEWLLWSIEFLNSSDNYENE